MSVVALVQTLKKSLLIWGFYFTFVPQNMFFRIRAFTFQDKKSSAYEMLKNLEWN